MYHFFHVRYIDNIYMESEAYFESRELIASQIRNLIKDNITFRVFHLFFLQFLIGVPLMGCEELIVYLSETFNLLIGVDKELYHYLKVKIKEESSCSACILIALHQ